MKQYLITIGLMVAALIVYDLVVKSLLEKSGLGKFENAEDEMEEI
jgi:hypothetical protein